MPLLTAERLDKLARAANAAPSADNRPVFRLAVRGETLFVLAGDALHGPPAHRQLLGLISTGAALENLCLRGAQLGIALKTTLEAVVSPRGLIARLEASAMEPKCGDVLEAAIDHRQSNRSLRYRPPELTVAQQSALSAQAEAVDGASLEWLDTASRRRKALALLRAAESERFCNPTLHKELFESIRFEVGWRGPAGYGLPPGALGLSPPERWGFALLRHWPVQRVGNLIGLHRMIGFRGADLPCRLAPHLVAVTTIGATGDPDAVAVGRALQRVWLSAASMGLSCQVFAAPGLYAMEATTDVRPDLRYQLRQGWRVLCPGKSVWMVMRLGRARPMTVRAERSLATTLWASEAVENDRPN
jgi:hypothetical protein